MKNCLGGLQLREEIDKDLLKEYVNIISDSDSRITLSTDETLPKLLQNSTVNQISLS